MNYPNCPRCKSNLIVKAGFQKKSKRQMYQCKRCGHRGTFTGDKGGRPKQVGNCVDCGIASLYAKSRCENCYRKLLKEHKQEQIN